MNSQSSFIHPTSRRECLASFALVRLNAQAETKTANGTVQRTRSVLADAAMTFTRVGRPAGTGGFAVALEHLP